MRKLFLLLLTLGTALLCVAIGVIAQPNPDPIIVAAGDIACDLSTTRAQPTNSTLCQMQATSDLLINKNLAAVLPLGDLQYEDGALDKFQRSYALSWGRLKSISRPVVGNHEYVTSGASGYFTYFGSAAGEKGKGYYSYNLGRWHLIALNANCSEVGGCQRGSAQEKWLKADLAAHPHMCTLAYWHQPRFSSGFHGNNEDTGIFWQDLYQAGADIVLNGHDHTYERFAPQTPNGKPDSAKGIREFVVGTGGKNLYPFRTVQSNSEVRNNRTFGVLRLALHPNRYDWKFLPIQGQSFTDQGTGRCHNAG